MNVNSINHETSSPKIMTVFIWINPPVSSLYSCIETLSHWHSSHWNTCAPDNISRLHSRLHRCFQRKWKWKIYSTLWNTFLFLKTQPASNAWLIKLPTLSSVCVGKPSFSISEGESAITTRRKTAAVMRKHKRRSVSNLRAHHHQLFLLKSFENDMYDIIKNITFSRHSNDFQRQLKADIREIRSSANVFVPADKSTNLYEMSTESYNRLHQNSITKSYKKCNANI